MFGSIKEWELIGAWVFKGNPLPRGEFHNDLTCDITISSPSSTKAKFNHQAIKVTPVDSWSYFGWQQITREFEKSLSLKIYQHIDWDLWDLLTESWCIGLLRLWLYTDPTTHLIITTNIQHTLPIKSVKVILCSICHSAVRVDMLHWTDLLKQQYHAPFNLLKWHPRFHRVYVLKWQNSLLCSSFHWLCVKIWHACRVSPALIWAMGQTCQVDSIWKECMKHIMANDMQSPNSQYQSILRPAGLPYHNKLLAMPSILYHGCPLYINKT